MRACAHSGVRILTPAQAQFDSNSLTTVLNSQSGQVPRERSTLVALPPSDVRPLEVSEGVRRSYLALAKVFKANNYSIFAKNGVFQHNRLEAAARRTVTQSPLPQKGRYLNRSTAVGRKVEKFFRSALKICKMFVRSFWDRNCAGHQYEEI